MSELKDLTGQRFGMLTVLRKGQGITVGNQKKTSWICRCDCGNEVEYISQPLAKGVKYSCGCTTKQRVSPRLEDLTGKRFGRLVVIEKAKTEHKSTRWKCKCDCGNECTVLAENLKTGHTTSCGCYREEKRPSLRYKHGQRHTRIYSTYTKIKDRCYNPNNPSYSRYGGRGITICDEWKKNPESFIKWAYDNGYDEKAAYGECTLDRIDNDKGYSPDNCRWVNEQVQANNRRSNKRYEYNGETHTIAEWSRILNVNMGTMVSGLLNGKTIEHYATAYKPRNTHPKK